MRLGRLLSLVPLVRLLAFPAVSVAGPEPLASTQADAEEMTVELEHTQLAHDAALDEVRAKPARPRYARAVVDIALRYRGSPYRWAGARPSGFDCSGFVMYVYAKVGVALPHNSAMLFGIGRSVSRDELAPGDLVFFNGLSHVGIYIGRGRFVHAPHAGEVVKISRLSESWYRSTYQGARRLGGLIPDPSNQSVR